MPLVFHSLSPIHNCQFSTIVENCGKTIFKACLSLLRTVNKCELHFFIFGLSTFFRLMHNVETLSTFYPQLKSCGKLWKTHYFRILNNKFNLVFMLIKKFSTIYIWHSHFFMHRISVLAFYRGHQL